MGGAHRSPWKGLMATPGFFSPCSGYDTPPVGSPVWGRASLALRPGALTCGAWSGQGHAGPLPPGARPGLPLTRGCFPNQAETVTLRNASLSLVLEVMLAVACFPFLCGR